MLVKYQPKTLLGDFFNDDFITRFFGDDLPLRQNYFNPAYDVIEDEKEYSLHLMLPAFNKEDFKLEVENNTLTISGERKLEDTSKFNVKQSYFGKFRKSYTLPNNVSKDDIDAKYENGVLLITIPKDAEKVKNRLIEIA